MFCHQCGTPLPEGARFCPSCGTKQILLPEEPTPVVQKQTSSSKGDFIQNKIKEMASKLKEMALSFKEKASKLKEKTPNFKEKVSKLKEMALSFKEKASKLKEKTLNFKEQASKLKETAPNFKEKAMETKKSFDKTRNESGSNNENFNSQKKKINWSTKEFTIPDWVKEFWSKCRTFPDSAKEKAAIAIDWLRPRFLPFCRKAGKSLLSIMQIILGLLLFLLAFVWEALKDFWTKFRTWPLQKQRIFVGCGAAVLVVCVVVGGMNRSSRSTPDYSSGSSYSSDSFSSDSSDTTSSGSSSFSGSSSSDSNSSSNSSSSGSSSSSGGSSSSGSSSSSGGTTGWFESQGGNAVPCPRCDSSGDVDCSACGGSGGKYVYDNSTPNYAGSSVSKSSRTWEACNKCHGNKKQKCGTCGGDHEL